MRGGICALGVAVSRAADRGRRAVRKGPMVGVSAKKACKAVAVWVVVSQTTVLAGRRG